MALETVGHFPKFLKKLEGKGTDKNVNKLGDKVGSGNEAEIENVGTRKDYCRVVGVEKSMEEGSI